MEQVTVDNIDDLAAGAAVLGAGGGADPYVPTLMVKDALRRHGPVRVVDVDDLPPEGLIIPVGAGGAPTALIEKFFAGPEWGVAVRALEKYLGRTAVALMAVELGGGNAVMPGAAAAELGLPVVDADGMRRCFPKVEMTLWTLEGVPASPGVLADTKGNVVVIEGVDNMEVERLTRASLVQIGAYDGETPAADQLYPRVPWSSGRAPSLDARHSARSLAVRRPRGAVPARHVLGRYLRRVPGDEADRGGEHDLALGEVDRRADRLLDRVGDAGDAGWILLGKQHQRELVAGEARQRILGLQQPVQPARDGEAEPRALVLGRDVGLEGALEHLVGKAPAVVL